MTAVALVLLTLWFVASIIAHAGSDYATFITWLQAPLTTLLMILLLIALFHNSALSLPVVIGDYVHSGFKFAAVIAVRLGCYGLAETDTPSSSLATKFARPRRSSHHPSCGPSAG